MGDLQENHEAWIAVFNEKIHAHLSAQHVSPSVEHLDGGKF